MSSARRFLSGVISFFALLKTLSILLQTVVAHPLIFITKLPNDGGFGERAPVVLVLLLDVLVALIYNLQRASLVGRSDITGERTLVWLVV
jgi:hypothetical protein